VLAFYRGQGSTGEGWPAGNGGVNVFNTIEDGEVKGRVKEGVLMAGRVKVRGSHSRHGAGRREVAGRGGIRWRCSRVGRCGVGDGADSRGPLDRERRERTRPARNARTKK
jgi:hypothetical protein